MKTLKKFNLIFPRSMVVVAALLGALGADDVLARSFGSWGSFGGWGSFGSWGSYGSSGSYGSYVSYRGYASYGSSGSYGSYGPVRYARYGYGSSGSSGSYGGSYYYYDSAPQQFAPEPPPPPPTDAEASTQNVTIHMTLPEDARVFVNDRATASTGAERNFVARGLRRGQTYAYRFRVEFRKGGEQVVENKVVPVKPGDAVELAFGQAKPFAAERGAKTELTVHVPKRAKVTLGGASTMQTGELRTYATSRLAAGETWDDYVVRVELVQDGKTHVEEKALTVVGGQKYELTFDFADEAATLAALD